MTHGASRRYCRNSWTCYLSAVPKTKPTDKQILAANLITLMQRRNDLKSQALIAAATRHNGTPVAQTSISNMLRPGRRGSPTLNNIGSVAAVFGLEAWQLLHPRLFRRHTTKAEK